MNDQFNSADNTLVRTIRIQKVIIGILILIVIVGIVVLILPKANKAREYDKSEINAKFFGYVDHEKAKKNLNLYRHILAYARLSLYPKSKINGILYDTIGFRKFINEDFLAFTQTHTPKVNCVWQLGVYPMICDTDPDGNAVNPKIGCYFIPTMIDTTKDIILDYLTITTDPVDYKYYIMNSRRNNPSMKFLDDENYIYDEGHLWP